MLLETENVLYDTQTIRKVGPLIGMVFENAYLCNLRFPKMLNKTISQQRTEMNFRGYSMRRNVKVDTETGSARY